MTHQRVKSSNLYSLAHDGKDTMEARFVCQACGGTGTGARLDPGMPKIGSRPCSNCKGAGYNGTYRGGVPEKVFKQVLGEKSPGAAFNKLIRGNSQYKLVKA